MYKTVLSIAVAASLGLCSLHAQADSLSDLFTQGHVDGQFRSYYFSRLYGAPGTTDANAFSTAVLINATTGSFGNGFSLTGSFLSANSFGSQSNNPKAIDTTLMGPGNSISSLGQAYLQYHHGITIVRAGYQYLNTPWMGGSDSRTLPASYNAISVEFSPLKDWDVYGIRTFEWKSRTSTGYYSDNLYYPGTYTGDNMYGGLGGLSATAGSFNGTWALGSTYAANGFKAQGWYYDFMKFARMGYVDGSYTLTTGSGFDPFVGAQWVQETSGSNNTLVRNNVSLFGVSGNQVKANAWGTIIGVHIPHGQVSLGYNKISQESGAVGDGAIISPYTAAYATDPLYTTSMIRGLVEMGPGHAWKTKVSYDFFDRRLQLMAAYTKYTTALRGSSHDTYVDLTYHFSGYFKGLSIRNRWERSIGGAGLNPGNGSFTYNRVMLVYKF